MEITVNVNNAIARILCNIARQKALEINVPMVIAFTDARGELVHFERMDKALPVSSDIAVNKAYTAAGVRISTDKMQGLVAPGEPLQGLELTCGGRMVMFGGGIPLSLNGVVVGAIGVSGGSVEEDMIVAISAVEALAKMEEMAISLKNILPDALSDFETVIKSAESIDALNGINPDILEGAFYLLPKNE